MPRSPAELTPRIRANLTRWAALWSVPELPGRVRVTFSSRFRVSLANYSPRTGEIRLSTELVAAPLAVFDEVLCHEAAHAAADHLEPGARPHGPEWAALVERAGYAPDARATWHPSRTREAPPRGSSKTHRYRHRCPVCQFTRTAARPVPRWRCSACVEAGLDGHLVVEPMPPPEERAGG